jgi:glutathione peroxidase
MGIRKMVVAALAAAGLAAGGAALSAVAGQAKPGSVTDPYVLDFKMKRLSGEEEALAAYKGKVVMIVNVASKCGLTPQYKGLEAAYQKYKDRGFVVLGFPANNFLGQEPGTDTEIAEFCERNYGVSFPMFSKISVKGDDQHPLYAKLTNQPAPVGGDVEWNFQKYLVDRSGNVVARYSPRTRPDDENLVAKIEHLLSQ